MDIEKTSALARQIKQARGIAYKMEDYPRKRAALSWLDMAGQSLATEEEDSTETATANLDAALKIIKGTDKQKEIDMATAKTTQPTTPAETAPAVSPDLAAIIAGAVAQAIASMPQQAASAPTAKKPANAMPNPVTAKAKSVTVTATATRATASTVVFGVADHGVLWADRGISVDRKALESLGNPGVVTITIAAK